MPERITLTYADERGAPRRVEVRQPRFTIGRGADNDLVIPDSNLSRRHALVEMIGGRPYLSDCGSSNGTAVNGRALADAAVELNDGDLINLGNSRELSVSRGPETPADRRANAPLDLQTPAQSAPRTQSTQPTSSARPTPSAQASAGGSTPSRLPVFAAAAAACLILAAGALLFALSLRSGGSGSREGPGDAREPAPAVPDATGATGHARGRMPSASPHGAGGDGESSAAGKTVAGGETATAAGGGAPVAAGRGGGADEQLGHAVRRVMSRISTDDAPYISEEGVRDVAAKVREMRASGALAGKLRAMSRGCGEMTALAQSINLKPSLLAYAALAQADAGDPVAAARRMTPKLLTLRATFGTETANSSLLLVAAYPYPFDPPIGNQRRVAHPLASKLSEVGGGRSSVETSVARSVWFLRERGAIDAEAYDLVVRLLAVGVVAQNPRRFGVDAEPLWC